MTNTLSPTTRKKRLYDPIKRREQYLKHKEKSNAASKQWYANNKERHKELREAWLENNLDRQHELQREWYKRNKETHLENTRQWSANNLDKKAFYRRRRRAMSNGAAGTATLEQLAFRLAFYGFKCAYCPGPFEEWDHVIPLSRGGSNWPANMRPACKSCNRKKHNMSLTKFLETHEALD